MKISIASGKGGTGKTSVSILLALALAAGRYIEMLDCDVETPNINEILNIKSQSAKRVNIIEPEIIEGKCTKCGLCVQQCKFNALALFKNKILFFPELCKSCGVCKFLCPEHAIKDKKHSIGSVKTGESINSLLLKAGILDIGEQHSGKIIYELKSLKSGGSIQIIDCPPGAGTVLFQSIISSDFCLLVTEPTILGLNDLKLAINIVKKLNIDFGIILNKFKGDNNPVSKFAEAENYDIMLKLEYFNDFQKIMSPKNINNIDGAILKQFRDLYKKIIGKHK